MCYARVVVEYRACRVAINEKCFGHTLLMVGLLIMNNGTSIGI